MMIGVGGRCNDAGQGGESETNIVTNTAVFRELFTPEWLCNHSYDDCQNDIHLRQAIGHRGNQVVTSRIRLIWGE